jgi:hypothetical protein
MTDRSAQQTRLALAARLRELRTSGLDNRPLNRKEMGRLLGESMQRPAGAYAARRVGDFENAEAKSPPPPDVLRAYAHIFGNGRAEDLEQQLLTLRDGIGGPAAPAREKRRRRVAAAAIVSALGVAAIVAVSLVSRSAEPAAAAFCARNVANRPAVGGRAIVCARDVLLRPSPGAPFDQALGTVRSGDEFTVDRYSTSGEWVRGTAHLTGGDVAGWIEGGWFCPTGTAIPATACG